MQVHLSLHAFGALEPGLGHRAHGLHPAKAFFDPLANLLADTVGLGVSGGSAIDGRVFLLGCNMGRDAALAQAVDEVGRVVALVSPQALGVGLSGDHVQARFSLGKAVGFRDHGIDVEAVAVLHERVADEAELGWLAIPFAVEPCLWISGAGMGGVAALLALEVGPAIAAFGLIVVVRFVLGTKALDRGPGFDQGAVDLEVFFAQQLALTRLIDDLDEEALDQGRSHQPIPVLREGAGIPDRIIHR